MVIGIFRHVEAGDQVKAGFADSAYGMSKTGVWKATAILAEQIRSDFSLFIRPGFQSHVESLADRPISW